MYNGRMLALKRLIISQIATTPLSSSWINFLGFFLNLTHDVNLHDHIYYNKQWDYHYSLKNPEDYLLRGGVHGGDTCIYCGYTNKW